MDANIIMYWLYMHEGSNIENDTTTIKEQFTYVANTMGRVKCNSYVNV